MEESQNCSCSSSSTLSGSLGEFIRKEVPDWDDAVKTSARFKAFSGQRSDWEAKLDFWRDLILKVARHLGVFLIRPSELKNIWFNQGGLTPLCLDHVLLEMHDAGDIVLTGDLVDPKSGRFSQIIRRVINMVGLNKPSSPKIIIEDHLILWTLLKDKAVEIVKVLSQSHWTSSCIITMMKFQDICGGSKEAYAVLSYLSGCGKAEYMVIDKEEFIEGVKVSLSPAVVSGVTRLDNDFLHLTWTAEKLQLQLGVIDHRHEMLRNSALTSLRSGNKKAALRHAREIKLASQSRAKCVALLDRVEEVLGVIADAESSKKVSEALQIGARVIRENRISLEEVQHCLEELDDTINSNKQILDVLGSTSSFSGLEDEDIEDEFKKLEFEVGSESSEVPMVKVGTDSSAARKRSTGAVELLGDALSSLKLTDDAVMESVGLDSTGSTAKKLPEAVD